MTHEHMDHVQGLLYASEKLGMELPVRQAWLTASAEPGYYEKHEKARRKKLEALSAYQEADRFLAAASETADAMGPMLLNNDPRNTGDCVEFLRHVAEEEPAYVHRELDIDGTHPFREAKLEVWAPEENTAIYYGSFLPIAFGVQAGGADGGGPRLRVPTPPRGVDTSALYSLVESRSRGVFDNLLSIDKAANNSSIVFALEWRGWRLLFPGDAEHRSWKEMNKRNMLKPVHFLKVSHHGSWNGTPPDDLLDEILPPTAPDRRKRSAAVSTCDRYLPGSPRSRPARSPQGALRGAVGRGRAGRAVLRREVHGLSRSDP